MIFGRALELDRRALLFAGYILENNTTVRETARRFGYSKSTVHKDLTVRLKGLNRALHAEVSALLKRNLSERHIRGGDATKRKYRELKEHGMRKSG